MLTVREWSIPIDALGIPAELHQTKAPNAVIQLSKVGYATSTTEDAPLLQSIGFGARIITVKAADLGAVIPVKFDSIKIHAKNYVVDTALPVFEPSSGNVMGYRLFCKAT